MPTHCSQTNSTMIIHNSIHNHYNNTNSNRIIHSSISSFGQSQDPLPYMYSPTNTFVCNHLATNVFTDDERGSWSNISCMTLTTHIATDTFACQFSCQPAIKPLLLSQCTAHTKQCTSMRSALHIVNQCVAMEIILL